MDSVSLLFKYLLDIDHEMFLWKVKIKFISTLFNVIRAWLFGDTFSDAMLYFLFRVKQSYRVRQGS